MDARSFSVNTLYDLLFNVDETKFNQTELKNIEFFREKARSAFEDEEEVLFNTESTFAIPKQAMDNEIIALQNNIIQNHPDIFDAIANDQDKLDLINSEMKFDARLALVESLTFMYNDQIAHKLMSSLLESIKNDSENALLYDYYSDVSNLYVFSNFQFNQEELEKFSNGGSSGNDEVISILNKNRKIYNEYLQDVERQN